MPSQMLQRYVQSYKPSKKMKPLLVILLFTVLSGCVSYKGLKLSSFTLNSKNANSKIVDRFPDYGDGHKDGCLVMAEMHLDLKTNKTGRIEGKVSDVSSGIALHNASVFLKTDLQQDILLATDSLGLFQTKIPGRLIQARVEYIGYRRMIIDL
jgi:hypothetical protein